MGGGEARVQGTGLHVDSDSFPALGERARMFEPVLRRHAESPLTSTELRRTLRPLVRAARDAGDTIEQLLVVLKRAWGDMPEARRAGTSQERARPLERVVTLCIEMYYEP